MKPPDEVIGHDGGMELVWYLSQLLCSSVMFVNDESKSSFYIYRQ